MIIIVSITYKSRKIHVKAILRLCLTAYKYYIRRRLVENIVEVKVSLKKQIILLMTDTTRKDMVGCYGNKRMITLTWML